MKQTIFKSISIALIYFAFAIFIEMVSFLLMGIGVFPRYFWFDIAIMAILAGIIVLVPHNVTRIVLSVIFLGVQVVLAIVNDIMYSVCGDLLTIEMISLAGEGLSAFDMSLYDWWKLVLILAIFLVVIVVYILIHKVPTPYVQNKRKKALYILLFFCLFEFSGYSWYALSYSNLIDREIAIDSDKTLFENLKSKTMAYQNFGSFCFYFKNFEMYYLNKPTVEDEKLKEYAQFLATNNTTPVTPYTGVSKGNNVITILLETMDYIAIDPYFTPFLYQLMTKDCYTLTNYYTENKTNVSEGLTLFGNYSADYSATSGKDEIKKALSNEYLPYTLANIVKTQSQSSVKTTYVHDNIGSYYNRDQVFPKAGYDTLITLDKMDKLKEIVNSREDELEKYEFTGQFKDFIRDSDMIETYLEEIAPTTGERFISSIATITMHGPHKQRQSTQKYYNQLMADSSKLEQLLEYLKKEGYTIPESDRLKEDFYWYKAAAMDVDKGLEKLFTHLKNNGLDKNTTVLLFSDHNCYYESLSWHFRNLDRSESYVPSLYQMPCMIYDQKLCSKANGTSSYGKGYQDNRFICTYNNLPTILDLLGIEYNPNIYMGCSIFDEKLNSQVFNTLKVTNSYFNDKIYMTHNVVQYSKEGVTEEEIDTFKGNREIIYQKQLIADVIYSNPKIFEIYHQITKKQ